MALLLCPSCNKIGFFYAEDDETGQIRTSWWCIECHYGAQEEDGMARPCQYCKTGEESLLRDEHRRYWWCYNCHRTTTIELINSTQL
jgi:hypothetical protein